MFRVDPVNEEGKIDLAFFSSDDYHKYKECLIRYLYAEGFDVVTGETLIKLLDRLWVVRHTAETPD
jgi:hypothetical protein